MTESRSQELLADVQEVCNLIATTLGPFGATKLLLEDDGTVTMTAAGAEVLDRCDLGTPGLELLRTAATDFRSQYRDGASSLVTLVGALLAEAERFRDDGLHPTTIERGYRAGLATAQEYAGEHSYRTAAVGSEAVARTALTALQDPAARSHTASEVAGVTEILMRRTDGSFDGRNLAVVPRVGGAASETQLVEGVVLETGPVTDTMPRSASGGIAVVSSTVDIDNPGSATSRRPSTRLSLSVNSFEERLAIAEREREKFEALVEATVDAGCEFLATGRSVNDRVKRTLANSDLLAVQRVDDDDLRRLARATGATIVGDFADIGPETLGTGSVAVSREAGRDMTTIESAVGEPVYTMFCRAPDPRTLDAFAGAAESAVTAVAVAERTDRVVPGGGAVEMGASLAVREWAGSLDSREQLAAEGLSRALTAVPRRLAPSAGLNWTDARIQLKTAHSNGKDTAGVDALLGEVRPVLGGEDPIADPAETKRAVWNGAVDLAVRLLRIDDQLPATDLSDDEETELSDTNAEG